ncbi:hypothetical protein [Chryseobacterium shigense]|uniref:hypothetical protein n=1 Tax=Chryseobacterium shigense TaxID=297244 RepID=UPI001617E357|nr:hypothetical protein [Chryseobacterium shigense]
MNSFRLFSQYGTSFPILTVNSYMKVSAGSIGSFFPKNGKNRTVHPYEYTILYQFISIKMIVQN